MATMLFLGLIVATKTVSAACIAPDPVNGQVSIPCNRAVLTITGNGNRSLPNPNSVPLGTTLVVKWKDNWTRNSILTSWNTEQQRTQYYIKTGPGQWSYNAQNFTMYPPRYPYDSPTPKPKAVIKARKIPGYHEVGWGVVKMRDVDVWNGGN